MMSSGSRNESGAAGRKRRKSAALEIGKSSQLMAKFLKKQKENGPYRVGMLGADTESDESTTASTMEPVDVSEVAANAMPILPAESAEASVEISERVQTLHPTVLSKKDIGLLDFHSDLSGPIITHELRTEMITMGSAVFQNADGPFSATDGRSMTKKWFSRELSDGRR